MQEQHLLKVLKSSSLYFGLTQGNPTIPTINNTKFQPENPVSVHIISPKHNLILTLYSTNPDAKKLHLLKIEFYEVTKIYYYDSNQSKFY